MTARENAADADGVAGIVPRSDDLIDLYVLGVTLRVMLPADGREAAAIVTELRREMLVRLNAAAAREVAAVIRLCEAPHNEYVRLPDFANRLRDHGTKRCL